MGAETGMLYLEDGGRGHKPGNADSGLSELEKATRRILLLSLQHEHSHANTLTVAQRD